MRRLTLNVLLSFAQFEREVNGERIHDKITASEHCMTRSSLGAVGQYAVAAAKPRGAAPTANKEIGRESAHGSAVRP